MDYETAKKLKGAGYPQKYEGGENVYLPDGEEYQIPNSETDSGYYGMEINKGEIRWREFHYEELNGRKAKDVLVYIPTLSELIEACGEGFRKLEKEESKWIAWYIDDLLYENPVEGSTPEIAVANLYLKLHERKN